MNGPLCLHIVTLSKLFIKIIGKTLWFYKLPTLVQVLTIAGKNRGQKKDNFPK